jgi:DNA-binding response OmpR family regulator
MKRILVIDDDKLVRETIVDTLIDDGHTVESAENGIEGLRTLRSAPFDLVVTDLYMPEKEGIEIIVEIRRDFPSVKILAVSGGETGQLTVAKLLGADKTLRKPFDLGDLTNTVKILLGE